MPVIDPKNRPNRERYVRILQRMTPEQKLRKALELGEFARDLFRQGLRAVHPAMTDAQLQALYLERLDRCHNRNC